MISKQKEAEILRYAHAEKWRVNTIAQQLGVHSSVVTRVLEQNGLPRAERQGGPSILDDYLPLILETLQQFPDLPASRLYAMAVERGFNGGPSHFRSRVAELRPRPIPEAYLRLQTLPGEQSQVDWAHFGTLVVGKAVRKLMAFVMVLSWSRRIYLQFFPDARMSSFLQGHVGAFNAWEGIPRVLLYDNLKSAVLERHGNAIHFHPTLLEFSAHYRFEPRPVGVRKGNEKGRVERAIRYIRDNFWPAREWRDLDDLNQQARQWCDQTTMARPCPQNRSMNVAQAFAEEQPRLITLPEHEYPTDERIEVKVGKTPYVRFDQNDYSVPHTYVKSTLLLMASPKQVRLFSGGNEVAMHPRSYDKGEQIEDDSHIEGLVAAKRAARQHQGQNRLIASVPHAQQLLIEAAGRGDSLAVIVRTLLQLLDSYGAQELNEAVQDALSRGVPHPNAVQQALERRRDERHEPPPTSITLPHQPALQKVVVEPHDLALYDQINAPTTPTEEIEP